ncbi:MAG: hypothetical protein A2830_03980 [Candidatus Taylorbacteria bacterium RIFCSPHIGHO2_01_FULL_44_110]|uniref:Glycerophosphoryl diester phosphodiesterase membrane domain-containing protein n=1 Tax=Candidatus Taylorbacteria bacterium RIFCSPHIGHO2_12_FULL_45_16 TaxID=1802315 RepID=A0A1G2MY75_9BACT|nr:MAG: hypothetical protein A2830_03980 [Candidatus Taylorbacteria bacterium RIFCSPHIGHO2_01_FULL_44_110]OHA28784.1 MAG: hypothetical protein A3F51_02260 [Candidatus Taylorbacteria bacterium RIFCSPHIGHO2_12_FULL_45_16]OHA32843.1 MAG: hypothetical protein A3A23_03060 [Candidatus Taylorbacteria bacterium RIFCSPLOWO2_01_FULL_45_59]OHA38234.1 MAG: hypothetical protein A3I98_02820 [Candidatus Taylorbacteria bacterium RIFCSPLOWO2_02_FULL_45_10b]OHA43954.1 MAG: hypothetical protein A3G04_00985 [Candi
MEPNTFASSSPSPFSQTPPAPTSTSQSSFGREIDGPMTLLKFGWRLLINHWKTLVPILILPSIISYIGSLLGITHVGVLVFIGVLISIVGAVFSVAMVPAVIDAIRRVSTDSTAVINTKEQYKFGFKYFWSFILVGIIFTFAQMGSFVLFVIPGIVVWVYASMYLFTLTVDGKKGFSALTESYSLIRERWWPVLGRIVLLGVVMMVAWLVLWAIISGVAAIFGIHLFSLTNSVNPVASGSIVMFTISAILNLIGTCILAPIGMGYTYKLYESLKATRSANIETKTFKNWLIAFICVGVVVMITIPIMISFWAVNIARSKAVQTNQNVQNSMADVQRQIDAVNLETIQQGQTNTTTQ